MRRWAAAVVGFAFLVAAVAASTAPAGAGLRQWGGTTIESLAPAAGQAASAHPPRVPARGHYVRLSNEKTDTYWAYESYAATVYAHPRTRSRRITKLHAYTEDGFPEVYIALRQYRDRQGRRWLEVRLPMRPNGTVGWVFRGGLGSLHLTHWRVVVNEELLRMFVYYNGHRRYSAPVAVGQPSTPTPKGHFWIRERFKISDPSSGYYPYALGTADYSTLTDWPGGGVVGIHGPYYQPQDIPGRVSHGCIRLHVSNDDWVGRHIGAGTPLLVK